MTKKSKGEVARGGLDVLAWGGARAGAGKKPLYDEGAMLTYHIKVTQRQKEKAARNGGAAWIRALIEAAPG